MKKKLDDSVSDGGTFVPYTLFLAVSVDEPLEPALIASAIGDLLGMSGEVHHCGVVLSTDFASVEKIISVRKVVTAKPRKSAVQDSFTF